MADDLEDPREVAWHPRLSPAVIGHEAATQSFMAAFASRRPHHAWLMTGRPGIGKATLAYSLARHVLSQGMPSQQVTKWIHARAHPDLAVLERSFNDSKPRKLRSEISVEDVRRFIDFFARTSSGGGWRVGLIDSGDDLNSEAANALLKLVEEPPAKTLIFLVSSRPGSLLRTLRSRCRTLVMAPLLQEQTEALLRALPLDPPVESDVLSGAARISSGSPGLALQLLNSQGAKAFQAVARAQRLDFATRNMVGQFFATRAAAVQEFEIFMGLLLEWLADRARQGNQSTLAQLHARLQQQQGVTAGYNLDRRVAVMQVLKDVDQALKTA